MWSRWRAPSAGLKSSTTRSARAGGTATLVPLDLKDSDGIARLAAALNERYGRLDILSAMPASSGRSLPLGHVEPKAWDEVIAVNVTANWHLIRSMDPLLRQSDAGRVVFVTSGVGGNPRAYWGPYAVSKAALDALARTYAAETATTNVRVNLFNPGPTRTRMRAIAMPGEDPASLKTADAVAEKIVELCLPDFQQPARSTTFDKADCSRNSHRLKRASIYDYSEKLRSSALASSMTGFGLSWMRLTSAVTSAPDATLMMSCARSASRMKSGSWTRLSNAS